MASSTPLRWQALLSCLVAACGSEARPAPVSDGLVVNEAMSRNEGAWIDGMGQTHDWVELVHRGSEPIDRTHVWLEDGSGRRSGIGEGSLLPGERILLWADGAHTGGSHLQFRLSGDGDVLLLGDTSGRLLDHVELPELAENEVFSRHPDASGAFRRCRYATPMATNGDTCAPPPPPALEDDVLLADFQIPAGHFDPVGPLAIATLALRPTAGGVAFVEIENLAATPTELSGYQLLLSPPGPSSPWPRLGDGVEVELGPDAASSLAGGERRRFEVPLPALAVLHEDPRFEGVLTLFERSEGRAVQRVDFMQWPVGARLERTPATESFRYCQSALLDSSASCTPLESRDIGERVRYLRTPTAVAPAARAAKSPGVRR